MRVCGQKVSGAGGLVAPPVALANAGNYALASRGCEVDTLPITPSRLLAKVEAMRDKPEQVA